MDAVITRIYKPNQLLHRVRSGAFLSALPTSRTPEPAATIHLDKVLLVEQDDCFASVVDKTWIPCNPQSSKKPLN